MKKNAVMTTHAEGQRDMKRASQPSRYYFFRFFFLAHMHHRRLGYFFSF